MTFKHQPSKEVVFTKQKPIINHQFGRCLRICDIRDNVVMTHDIRRHVSRLRDCAVSPAISGHSESDQVTHSHSAADLRSIKSIPTKDGT